MAQCIISSWPIHRTKKDCDWHSFPLFLVRKSPKYAHKSAGKSPKNFKRSTVADVVSKGTNFTKKTSVAVSGSQGTVVKCKAAVFYGTVY